jgi:hypothetical protein
MTEKKTTILEKDDNDVKDDEKAQQDQAGPFKDEIETEGKKPWGIYIIIALLAIALLTIVFLYFQKKDGDEGSPKLRQMQQLASNIRSLETEVKDKQDEMFNLMKDYKDKTGKPFLGVNPLNLNEQEQKLLEQKIREEKDVSIKSLLEEINEKNNEIKDIQNKIKELEALLPKPHIVTEGDIHYEIAMNFLVNEKKVEKERAMKLIERVAMIDTLVPGFKIWNFYSGNEFGTSVTQGTAPISPNTLIRRARKKLVDARDEAISEKNKLAEDIQALEEKRTQIIKQLDILNNEKQNLITKVTELNDENSKMQTTVNSLFYLLDLERNLKKKGILKKKFLKSAKIKKTSPEYFTMSIDLRSENAIPIAASTIGVSRIKSITIYPKFYKKEIDYKVMIDPDKQNATVTFLNPDKFKSERLIISIK